PRWVLDSRRAESPCIRSWRRRRGLPLPGARGTWLKSTCMSSRLGRSEGYAERSEELPRRRDLVILATGEGAACIRRVAELRIEPVVLRGLPQVATGECQRCGARARHETLRQPPRQRRRP